MIELIANIFKVLNSETEPRQISLAACLAMIAGLTPLARPHNLLVLLLVLLLRVTAPPYPRLFALLINSCNSPYAWVMPVLHRTQVPSF